MTHELGTNRMNIELSADEIESIRNTVTKNQFRDRDSRYKQVWLQNGPLNRIRIYINESKPIGDVFGWVCSQRLGPVVCNYRLAATATADFVGFEDVYQDLDWR